MYEGLQAGRQAVFSTQQLRLIPFCEAAAFNHSFAIAAAQTCASWNKLSCLYGCRQVDKLSRKTISCV